jgi:hypothetical protein
MIGGCDMKLNSVTVKGDKPVDIVHKKQGTAPSPNKVVITGDLALSCPISVTVEAFFESILSHQYHLCYDLYGF